MATINQLGIPGLGTGILQPKLKNRWRVTWANIGGGTPSIPLSLQAITVNRPTLTFEEVALHRYNSVAYVAGKHSWNDLSVTVQDDVTGSASKVVQSQLQKQQWLIGAEGQWLAATPEGSGYKFSTIIDMLDGNEQVIEKWTVEGCWIKEANYGELDYGASDAVIITLSIRYDHARQDIGGYNYGEGVGTGGAGP